MTIKLEGGTRMFFRKHKQLIAGVIIGSVISGTGVVFADQDVSAVLSTSIRFKFNGQEKQSPDGVLVYNGRTYVPARFVAEQLGANVTWDGNTRTVNITSGEPQGGDQTPPVQSGAKVFPVDIDISSGPMKMHISKITLDPAFRLSSFDAPTNAVIFTVETENTSPDTISWYPDQGKIVLNTKEQVEYGNSFDGVGGEYIGNVKKDGTIVFRIKSKINDISSIKYIVDGPYDSNFERVGDNVEKDIVLR
jgi:hypothetical protein